MPLTAPRSAKSYARRLLCGACAALLSAGSAFAATDTGAPADPTGEWRVAKGVAIIRVVDCDGQYWGVVAWEQRPGVDTNNPDPAKRSRPTLGMPILLGMSPSGRNEWSGEIYNSEDGRTYSAKISLPNPNTLKVQGCVFGFLCGGEEWSRVDTDATTGVAPGSASPAPGAARNPSRAAPSSPSSPRTQAAEEICLGLVGPAGSTHQRGLK